jgi:hypothetical protein
MLRAAKVEIKVISEILGPRRQIYNAKPGSPCSAHGLPGEERRLGDLNPGRAMNPNRISSAAP